MIEKINSSNLNARIELYLFIPIWEHDFIHRVHIPSRGKQQQQQQRCYVAPLSLTPFLTLWWTHFAILFFENDCAIVFIVTLVALALPFNVDLCTRNRKANAHETMAKWNSFFSHSHSHSLFFVFYFQISHVAWQKMFGLVATKRRLSQLCECESMCVCDGVVLGISKMTIKYIEINSNKINKYTTS